jgi:cbb3-type cytochrome oxidase subunit 3
MAEFKKIVIIIAIIIFFVASIYFQVEKRGHDSTAYAKKLALDKFFVSNGCKLEGNALISKGYEATYLCRDFDAYRYDDLKEGSYLVVKYNSPATASKIEDLFNGPFYGRIFMELFNCSVITYVSGNFTYLYTYNCAYGIDRRVKFEKLDEYTVRSVGVTRLINLTKTTKEDLVAISRKLYGKMLDNYVNLTVPPELLPDACEIDVVEGLNSITVKICGDTFSFKVLVNPLGLSEFSFPHNFERFFE